MYVLCYLYLYTYNIYYLSNNVWHLKSFPASTDIKYLKTLPEAQRTQDIESKNWIISKKKTLQAAWHPPGDHRGDHLGEDAGQELAGLLWLWHLLWLRVRLWFRLIWIKRHSHNSLLEKRTISSAISIIYLFLKDLSIVWWHCGAKHNIYKLKFNKSLKFQKSGRKRPTFQIGRRRCSGHYHRGQREEKEKTIMKNI